jgi:hypothetical protein
MEPSTTILLAEIEKFVSIIKKIEAFRDVISLRKDGAEVCSLSKYELFTRNI